MPPKQKVPAPIDRPLSRAYLREFKGWSTAYPPGMSDPTSLRVMENILINRDGSAAIRPGLRLLSREGAGNKVLNAGYRMVSTLEPFYSAGGSLLHLAALLDSALNRVVFRVLRFDDAAYASTDEVFWEWLTLTDVSVGFDLSAWSGEPGDQPSFSSGTTYVKFVQIDNRVLALSDNGEELIVFHVGATKKVTRPQNIQYPAFTGHPIRIYETTNDWVASPQTTAPAVATQRLGDTSLLSNDATKNVYNYAFFYTFENELGESAPNQAVSVKLSQPWGGWRWMTVSTAGNVGDSSTVAGGSVPTTDPKKSADQLILRAHEDAYAAAMLQNATRLNVYMMSWSDQSPVPVEAQLIATKDLTPGLSWTDSWVQLHPGLQYLNKTLPIPTTENGVNSTKPSAAAQGVVAADRVVLVNDKTAAAVVRWSTNEMGNYLNFAASRGGGYKTLTAGNLQIPATVKLWQNPQSVDTLTVLCMGTDGYSTSYYMAPANVTSQSDNTTIMGFEETTATPGTVSPYGCEVANNALYHPLDDQLMKSTASNYNINHKSMTDQISNRWQPLANKNRIVSCFHDQRLYFLVHNPDRVKDPRHHGNEVWVLDLAAEGGTWSRWLVGGVTLRKVAVLGKLVLALVRPEGVYYFDESKGDDDVIEVGDEVALTQQVPIAWKLETNIQGANRAHDAWCHLQQANLTVGNFTGTMRYGIRSKDRHGRVIEKAKLLRQLDPAPAERFDIEDMLLVKADLREWFFFAESVEDAGVVRPSYGQLNLVQYRYTPISVNQDYEEGSVETFEYGRDTVNWADRNTLNGVTIPRADTGSP